MFVLGRHLTLNHHSPSHSPLLLRPAPSITPNLIAFWYVAPRLRFSLRAITVVFIFLRARVFSVQTSSFVHGRSFNVFFAIAVTHVLTLSTNQPAIVIN